MRRIRSRVSARTVRQLPGNKQATFASDFHSRKSLVEARNYAAESLRKSDRLHVPQLRLAIVSQHGLSVFVFQREPVIFGGIELTSIGREPPRVQNLVNLVLLRVRARAYLDVLIAERKSDLDDPAPARHTRWQLQPGSGRARGGRSSFA